MKQTSGKEESIASVIASRTLASGTPAMCLGLRCSPGFPNKRPREDRHRGGAGAWDEVAPSAKATAADACGVPGRFVHIPLAEPGSRNTPPETLGNRLWKLDRPGSAME